MPLFENKVLLITGGTGSFGHAVLDRFLTTDIREIRILSRDEKKQDDMRHAYQLACPACAEKIKFYIGAVRDYRPIAPAFRPLTPPPPTRSGRSPADPGRHSPPG